MPEDFVQSIAERVAAIAKKTAESASPVRVGTVLSVNPDGSVNVDDGQGGCARVATVSNQVVTCGSTVVLGLEPQPGNTTDLCQVQFAINSSSKGCPVEDRIDDNEVDVIPEAPYMFVDNAGNQYAPDGSLIGNGADLALVDDSYGYGSDPDPFPLATPKKRYAGPKDGAWPQNSGPWTGSVIIGDLATGTGHEGESYYGNNTILCLGLGVSSGVLCGAEINITGANTLATTWTITLRDASDFSLNASNAATYISGWMTAHAAEFPGDNTNYDVNISPDPEDGTFWVGVGCNSNVAGAFTAGMFNIDPSDGSLIATVGLEVPTAFFQRAKRFVP